jgi:hypothetical protein
MSLFLDEGLSESDSVVSSMSCMFLFCSCHDVALGTTKMCSHTESICMTALPAGPTTSAYRGQSVNCRVEDRNLNMQQILDKKNVKFLQ